MTPEEFPTEHQDIERWTFERIGEFIFTVYQFLGRELLRFAALFLTDRERHGAQGSEIV